MKRLIVPPLPAASRPSNNTTTRWPESRTHACSFSSSTCRWYFCASYALRDIRLRYGYTPLRQCSTSSSSELIGIVPYTGSSCSRMTRRSSAEVVGRRAGEHRVEPARDRGHLLRLRVREHVAYGVHLRPRAASIAASTS